MSGKFPKNGLISPARRRIVSTAAQAALLAFAGATPRLARALTFLETGPALLADGTSYGIRVPTDPAWNGTVLNDLDYVGARNNARSLYWLNRGYAMSGIQRHPNRRYAYDPVGEVQNLFTVLDILEKTYGKPSRVIAYGTSAGGQLALAQSELFPNRVHGAVAGGATTPMFTSGIRFDMHFILKALLDPNNAQLIFLGVPDDSAAITAAWQNVIKAAASTPQGRAKIALAFAITQWPAWTLANQPMPDFNNDIGAVIEQVMLSAVQVPVPAVNTQFLFETQVGVWIGNDGADYKGYYHNADPWTRRAAEQLYNQAGLDLKTDLDFVDRFPRAITNTAAADFWLARNERTHRGTPQVPTYRFHNIGDPQAHTPQMEVYNEQVQKSGRTPLYRTGYTVSAGHLNFTLAEYAAAMEVMNRRLDTGKWPNTSAVAMNQLALELAPATGPAGVPHFTEHHLRDFNGKWRFTWPNKK